jgi:zinc transporter 9
MQRFLCFWSTSFLPALIVLLIVLLRDMETLPQYKRRNPYDEQGQESLITVYLRSDVEKKAIEIWGSLENIQKEKDKRKKEFYLKRKALFHLKKTLRDYKNRIEQLENPLAENSYTNASLFKTFSGKVVLSAVAINAANFVVKLVGWMYTGSASLFAEAVHSLADTCNQLILGMTLFFFLHYLCTTTTNQSYNSVVLAFGLHQSFKRPNSEHPYGYSNMTYITSLISGVGIFFFGTGLSWYHGVMGIIDPHPLVSVPWAMALLAGSAISESGTLLMAYIDTRDNAKKLGLGFWQYVSQGYKPSVNVVLLEDIAAVSGVFIAGTCMFLTYMTNNPLYDACGSIAIGCVLGKRSRCRFP